MLFTWLVTRGGPTARQSDVGVGPVGFGTCPGVIFGSPFPTSVYLGHLAYKQMGARTGCVLITGLFVCAGLGLFFPIEPGRKGVGELQASETTVPQQLEAGAGGDSHRRHLT